MIDNGEGPADSTAVKTDAWQGWQLTGLRLEPGEEWKRMREFVDLEQADIDAMTAMIEPLARHEHEIVTAIYKHLERDEEMSLILGWENGPDGADLARRRQYLTLWLSRTIGMDLSDDFARFLFDAGRKYAGDGPGQVRVPERYVVGIVNLIYARFMDTLMKEVPVDAALCRTLLAWNKMLIMQLTVILAGYHSACDIFNGDFPVKVSLFSTLREAAGQREVTVYVPSGSRVETVLRRLFEYLPQLRAPVFEAEWIEGERNMSSRTPTLVVEKAYELRRGRRVTLNGRDLARHGGAGAPLAQGDELAIY